MFDSFFRFTKNAVPVIIIATAFVVVPLFVADFILARLPFSYSPVIKLDRSINVDKAIVTRGQGPTPYGDRNVGTIESLIQGRSRPVQSFSARAIPLSVAAPPAQRDSSALGETVAAPDPQNIDTGPHSELEKKWEDDMRQYNLKRRFLLFQLNHNLGNPREVRQLRDTLRALAIEQYTKEMDYQYQFMNIYAAEEAGESF